MDGRKQIGPRVASAFVVAIAVAIVWAMALMWSGYFFMMFAPTDQVYEGIDVMLDGTPVIQSRSMFNPMAMETTYRTLDGKPLVDPSRDGFISSTTFRAPVKPPGLYEASIPWTARIAGLSDMQRPPVSWYLVRDEEPIGRAYFTGFDQTTKLPVGYIGRGGFSRAKPARDQWFDVGRDQLGWGSGAIVNSGRVEWAQKVYAYSSGNEDAYLPTWLAFVVDSDRVLVVDLRTRTVQPYYQAGGLAAVAMLYEARTEAAAKPAAVAAPPKEPDGLEPATDASQSKRLLTRIAARTADRIAIFNWPSKNKREFTLPESMRDKDFAVTLLPSGELLLNWSNNRPETTTLTWIRPDGTVAREREVSLARYGGEDEQTAAWMAAVVAPIPVGWAAVVGVLAPLGMIQTNQVASYGDAMAKILTPSTLPLVAIALCGVFLAWITFRIQRKYHRQANGLWVAFVLLLGVPGFLAYLIEHRRAKLEACGECGKVVPRDREACAACETEFAAPARLGTEIFA